MFRLIFWICSIVFLITEVFGTVNVKRRHKEDESAEDLAFGAFMWVTMKNYTHWLALYDPLSPIPDEIKLKSDRQVDFGVDASLEIKNQFMSGHSNSLNTIFTPVSELDRNAFSVTRGVLYDQPVEYVGDYTTTGSAQLSNQNVCFHGSGKWNLTLIDSFEHAQFVNFVVNDEGYIDLTLSVENNHNYLYSVNWTNIDFEGLEIVECEGNKNDEAKKFTITRTKDVDLIKGALAQVYKRFLNSFAGENPNKVIPPKRLLFDYLTKKLLETKLSDILSDWAPSTTTTSSKPSGCVTFQPSHGILLSFVILNLYEIIF